MEDIILYLNIIRKRWPWATVTFLLVFSVLGVRKAITSVPLYRASGRIVFESNSPGFADPLSFSFGNKNNINNNLVIIESELLVKEIRKDLPFPLVYEDNTEIDNETFVEGLTVINPEESDVIELSYLHEDPEKATAIVNTWIENYVNLDKEIQKSKTQELTKFLEKQIPFNQKELENTAEKLKDFKQNNRILDITAEATSTIEIISELDGQMAKVQAELASLRSRRDSLREIFPLDSETAITSSFINESPVVSELIVQIQEVQTKIKQEKLRFGDQHPQVIALQKQERLLQEQLNKYAPNIFVNGNLPSNSLDRVYQPGENQSLLLVEYATADREIKSLEAQLKSLNKLISVYRERVDTLPNLEFQQQQLQRELVSRDEVVQNLVKAYQDAQIALNSTQSNIRTVQYAYMPEKPAVDRKLSNLVKGFLAGIIMGSLAAYIREKLDTGISNLDQVKEYFAQPVLAEVPDFQKHSSRNKKGTGSYFSKTNAEQETITTLPVKDNPKSPISEAFRGLCTSIKFMETENKPLKVLTISSSVAGEGKSTLTANTAIAASELGGRVLIIEADLRKPGQRKIWDKIDKQTGLGDLLQSDHQLDWSKQTINVLPNLDVLPAGQSKSNPVALIGSPEMVHLMDKLKEVYDWIIIDAPPVSVAADAQILGRMSDGILLVIRQGKANTSMLKAVSQSLAQAEINVLGLLLNCFSSGSGGSYYYNYYYNYSYYYDNKEKKHHSDTKSKLGQFFSNKK